MIDRLLGADDNRATLGRLTEIVEPGTIVVGWATVDLDRAEIELGADAVAHPDRPGLPVHDDDILGARCRLLDLADDHHVVLLEPSTEGRLAAALARHGEGPTVAYLLTTSPAVERVRRAGLTVTTEGRGPFGAQRLVLPARRSGPFLILAGAESE